MKDELEEWCRLANAAAYEIEGVRNTCIQTSHALATFLQAKGLEAEVFRAEARIWCLLHERECTGSLAGSNGDGTRRPKSSGWHGHLAVSCGDYVLDPTIDQLEVTCGLRPSPAVFLKPKGWSETPPNMPWSGGAWYHWTEDGLDINHSRYRKQIGWKSKPAALPSRWRDILDTMNQMLCHT